MKSIGTSGKVLKAQFSVSSVLGAFDTLVLIRYSLTYLYGNLTEGRGRVSSAVKLLILLSTREQNFLCRALKFERVDESSGSISLRDGW